MPVGFQVVINIFKSGFNDMIMTIERIGYEKVNIDPNTIDLTSAQARQKNIDADTDELANSIEHQGLFSPVLLVMISNEKYELIAGQRRIKAYRKLNEKNPNKFSKIDAFIYKNTMDEWEKKAISISENFNQEPMSEGDKIAAVTACYNTFGSIRITSEKTRISNYLVKKYVRYERLPSVLRTMKDDGKITLSTALHTADLFGFDTSDIGVIPEDEIKKMCHRNSTPHQQSEKTSQRNSE